MLFHLPSTAIVGPGDDIVYPTEGKVVHFEGELGVVIGRPTRRVAAADYHHVFAISQRIVNGTKHEAVRAGILEIDEGVELVV